MTHKLTSILAVLIFSSANMAMAGNESDGSMDLEKPVSEIQGTDSQNANVKQNKMTGDARGSTTGKKLIKSDAQRHEAEEGGLDGAK